MAERETMDGVAVERVSPGRGSRWRKMATYIAGMTAATLRARRFADVIQVQQALYPAAAMVPVAAFLRKPLIVRNAGSGHAGAMQLMSGLPLGSTGLAMLSRG